MLERIGMEGQDIYTLPGMEVSTMFEFYFYTDDQVLITINLDDHTKRDG